MKLLNLYKLFGVSMTDFINPFKNNEALYNQARAYWNKLENSSVIILVIFIVLGISMAVFYYQPYNNRPGRHYTPKHWLIFLACNFLLTFFVTWGFEFFAAPPRLDGSTILQLKIALGNACFSTLLFFVVSVIWCNLFPTNAYRLFKF